MYIPSITTFLRAKRAYIGINSLDLLDMKNFSNIFFTEIENFRENDERLREIHHFILAFLYSEPSYYDWSERPFCERSEHI